MPAAKLLEDLTDVLEVWGDEVATPERAKALGQWLETALVALVESRKLLNQRSVYWGNDADREQAKIAIAALNEFFDGGPPKTAEVPVPRPIVRLPILKA